MVDIIGYENGHPIGKNGKRVYCLPGDSFINKKGQKFTVIAYTNALNIEVEFECGTKATTSASSIRKGTTRNPSTTSVNGKEFTVSTGDKFTNSDGAVATVIEYISGGKAKIVFDRTGYEVTTNTYNLRNGKDFKDPYHPTKFGVGYCGTKYPCHGTRQYHLWNDMLHRCYGCDYTVANKTYHDVFVEDYLHSYENFYEFVTGIEGFHLGYEMEKDLLVKNNKLYSRETICFVPKIINVAIQGGKKRIRDEKEGELPTGVFYRKDTGKYRATSGEYGKLKHCGQFDKPIDAFYAYKQSKEAYLKELAIQYKSTIDKRAFDALINYNVEIDD